MCAWNWWYPCRERVQDRIWRFRRMSASAENGEEWRRRELNYFLVSLGLLSSVFNWSLAMACPMWMGKTVVVKHSLYIGCMSRKLNPFRSEKVYCSSVFFLIFWHVFLSVAPCCSHQIRNRMCLCIPIFAVGYKAEVTNQLWVFVLEYLWVKVFQIHRTLIGEVVKTLLHWAWYNSLWINFYSGENGGVKEIILGEPDRWGRGRRMLTAWCLPPRELNELRNMWTVFSLREQIFGCWLLFCLFLCSIYNK